MSSDYFKRFMLLCNVQIKILFVKAYIIPAKALYFNPHVQRYLEFWDKRLVNLNFAGYTGCKNQLGNRQKNKFVQLDFTNLVLQKSSADQYGEPLCR